MIRNIIDQCTVSAIERGLVPDAVTRAGIRRLCRERLRELDPGRRDPDRAAADFITAMAEGPVAPVPEKANEQHYELPAAFFRLVLGRHLKYSCGDWSNGAPDLDTAERLALTATCARAELADGMEVLELGCGWGSLSLWMAREYPGARITAVSNSVSQRSFIEAQARDAGLENLRIVTADMNDFDPGADFDRVVSVEMFEHMRNWPELLRRVAGWLRPEGKLFVHIFTHRSIPYTFETAGAGNWMGRHFFTGGIMPSADLLRHVDGDLRVSRQWQWDGTHYARTAEAWLVNLDRNRAAALPILAATYGRRDAARWLRRWRVFFMACAELFAYEAGREWGVTHALLEHAPSASPAADRDALIAV